MFDKITELRSLREQRVKLREREAELSVALVTDVDLIPVIYGWFAQIHADRAFPRRLESVYCRKQFIFIVLFLYAPGTLAGGRMPNGLRDRIARACCLNDVTFISHNIENIVFQYRNYKDFRSDVHCIYTEVLSRLEMVGRTK